MSNIWNLWSKNMEEVVQPCRMFLWMFLCSWYETDVRKSTDGAGHQAIHPAAICRAQTLYNSRRLTDRFVWLIFTSPCLFYFIFWSSSMLSYSHHQYYVYFMAVYSSDPFSCSTGENINVSLLLCRFSVVQMFSLYLLYTTKETIKSSQMRSWNQQIFAWKMS